MHLRGQYVPLALLAASCWSLMAAGCLFSLPGTAHASELALEMSLNRLSKKGADCRFTFVFRNALGSSVKKATLELVVFTEDGLVDRFVNITTGAMPAGKTRAKQFDFDKLDCTRVKRVLVNDVKACEGKDLTPQLCLSKLAVSGTQSIDLGL